MSFDWLAFFSAHGIEYIEKGPNVAKNNVNIHCPMCGEADKSMHMGVSKIGKGWYCFRNNRHRGLGPVRLIRALLGCSWERAEQIAGIKQTTTLSTLRDRFRALGKPDVRSEVDVSEIKREWQGFASIRESGPAPAVRYLRKRNWGDELEKMAKYYRLRYGASGRWAGRIILPIYCGGLRGWTGRAIGKSDARYLSWPGDVKDYLFNFDRVAEGGRILFLVEGPFDAIRLDFWGKAHGARAAGLLGVSPTEVQLGRLCDLAPRFDRVAALFDEGAAGQSLAVSRQLRLLGAVRASLPRGVKDPDLLDPAGVEALVAAYA